MTPAFLGEPPWWWCRSCASLTPALPIPVIIWMRLRSNDQRYAASTDARLSHSCCRLAGGQPIQVEVVMFLRRHGQVISRRRVLASTGAFAAAFAIGRHRAYAADSLFTLG